ncbi:MULTISPECIES: AAA family ATPase [unclassified Saccharibacter]|uniref:AAA family ATPase n=1 Tax=unclassified Saccharibacter TaxID=2648722 RepID=UPI001321C6CF|nr:MULTISPECIES: AAA family ATPase [unclassified Saccharibacter]MXV35805.1 AAA family ATPase [Saccharibacter sp. EH611]MXV57926.1 AAA family ATPase [Saccharibacter sp. EH70]MXV66321.1 AAA family ATPase [Saccharibacter sp. EH60]
MTSHTDLINTIKAIQERNGLSQSQISRESGIPKGTLNQFLAGKYTGDNDKVALKAQRWVDTNTNRHQLRQKLRQAPDFVMLPSCERWMNVFEYAQIAQDIGVITGAPGTSKTMTAEYYCSINSNAWLITADSSLKTPHAILRDIAETVDAPVKNGSRLMSGLIKRLRGTQGLLIIDEAQHLTTAALDQLRALNDRAGIGIAWIGNEPLRGRIEGMGREASYAQIFSRVGMWKNRRKPTKGDLDHMLSQWGTMESDVSTLLRWIGSQEGGLRELNKTLRFAWFIASNDGRDSLRISDIEMGWNERRPQPLPKRAEG